jgi:hypothetical protein
MSKFRKDFIGLDGFQWWFGVVENRNDPLLLGRCQVRIYGIHSPNLTDIPSADLPWALPVHSLNNQTFSTPKEGDYVFGFFIDGSYAQQPVMMGIVPGIPESMTDPNSGFADLRTPEEIANSPKRTRSVEYATDGTGATLEEYTDEEELSALRNPSAFQIGFPTNSPLARNEQVDETILSAKKASVVTVPISEENQWKEPDPAYDAEYPFNKVWETESGHIMEFDDTPGSERVHIAHRSGTFQEIYPSGTKVEKIVKNNYKIVFSDHHVYIKGRVNLTVESNVNMKVYGHVNLEAHNDINANVAGSVNYTVGGDFNVKAENINLEANSYINQLANTGVFITGNGDDDDGGVFIVGEGSVGLQGGEVSVLSTVGTTITAGIDISLTAGGFIAAQAGGAVSIQAGAQFNVLAAGTAAMTAATVGLNGAVISLTSAGLVNLQGTVVGVGASLVAPLQTFTTFPPSPIIGVPIPGIPAGEVIPASPTGLGDPLELLEYNDPPVFFEKSPSVRLPPDRAADIEQQILEYVKNPNSFYNEDADRGDVKSNYQGTPDTSGFGDSLINPNNPNIDDASDLAAWLEEQLSKTSSGGFWLETGMSGGDSNPNIINIWKDLGFGNRAPWNTDQTAWCMGFINYGLKQNGYRFVQTARAFDIRDRLSDFGATQVINPSEARPGDIALWKYSHVSFVYKNNNGALSFVGGNQKSRSSVGGSKNNPSQGDVSISWQNGYSSPGDGTLLGIFRPVKV